jgi:hypothetical protein
MTSSRTISRIHTWIWVLIYGGLLLLVLGLATARTDANLGWIMVGVGAVLAVAGAVLVWVRSRMTQDNQ